jgi:deoxyribose-phosphate aldolase
MASTLSKTSASQRRKLHEESVVAIIDAAELKAAQKDPRVRSFLDEADAYLTDLEQQGRNR